MLPIMKLLCTEETVDLIRDRGVWVVSMHPTEAKKKIAERPRMLKT